MQDNSMAAAAEGPGAGEVCRTCLGAQALAPLFPKPAQYRSYQLALRLCTGLQMDFDDGLPQYICRICNQTVKALMLFRFQSQSVNESLWNFYKNKNASEQKVPETPETADPDSVKSEKLPTTDEIKLEANNRLAEFYKNKNNIPKMLYCISKQTKPDQNLVIEKAVLSNASELIAEQRKLVNLCGSKKLREMEAKIKSTPNIVIDPINESMENALIRKGANGNENRESIDVKPTRDKIKYGQVSVKSEFNQIDNIKTESTKIDVRINKNRFKRRTHKRNIDTSDSDDDMSDRGEDLGEEVSADALAETSGDNDKAWNISVVRDNVIEVKPLIEIVPIAIEATKKKLKKRVLRPRANATSSSQHLQGSTASKVSRSSRKVNKALKRSKNGKKTSRTPVKKIYIVRKDKKEEFRRKCWELINGPFDIKSQNVKCKICNNTYKDIYTFERHAQRHLGYMHICEYCNRGFESRDVLLRHLQVKHPDGIEDKNELVERDSRRMEFRQKCLELVEGAFDQKSDVKCKICHNVYKDIYTFERHAQRHLGYRHICDYCQRGFESRDIMVRHMQKKHPAELKNNSNSLIAPLKENDIIRRYNDDKKKEFRQKCLELIKEPFDSNSTKLPCKLCNVVCKNIRYFETHSQKHLGFSHLCEFCARGFPSQAALTRHHKLTHTERSEEEDKPAKPARKPKESRQNLYALIEGPYHSKSKNVQCKVCKGFFSNLQAFANHAQRHVGFKQICEFCAKGFPSKAHLKQHLQAKHNFAREFACSYCDYMAIYQKQLQIHTMRFHTKERPFVCDECGSGYFSKPVLTQHIRQSHQKEKPFQCDECPRRFKQLNQRNYHKKMQHHPTFKFLCHICNNTFTKSRHVRKHFLKIHKIPREQQVEKVHRLYFEKPEETASFGDFVNAPNVAVSQFGVTLPPIPV